MIANSMYTETYRPQFHYSPASAWMNDPNGMVYYEGEYHLFYQHHPHSSIWGPMHWGHAVSKDLLHWEQLPIALKPDHNGAIFSGSAVVDFHDTSGFFGGETGLVAIFTQHLEGPDNSSVQHQSLAYSKDKGRSWTIYPGNPVLEDRQFVDFRDPKVFWDEDRMRWCMVLAAGDRVVFYHSPNLKDWEFGSEFGQEEGSHDGVWECPDLFRLSVDGDESSSKWVLLVSIGDSPEHAEGSRTQYFLGEFDGGRFVNDSAPEQVRWLDCGRDNYAGVTWSDIPSTDGRRLFIGWMSNWKYANETPTEVWRSAMTIPRELTLAADDVTGKTLLVQKPARELTGLRTPLLSLRDVLLDEQGSDVLGCLAGDCYELEAEFELGDANEFGFSIRAGNGEETIVGYNAPLNKLFIDRSLSGSAVIHEQFACRHDAELLPESGRIRMRIYVDWSSVEVFGNGGKTVMTDLIFPHPDSKGMRLYCSDGSVRLISLDLYRIKSIW